MALFTAVFDSLPGDTEVVFLMSNTDDIRILLKPPKDGQFSAHKYQGVTLTIDISRDENRAFVAKLATSTDLCPPEYLGNLNLLHPNHYINYFPLLLDMIIVDIDAASKVSFEKKIKEELRRSGV